MGQALKVCPVILAGGEGTRLWPLSRRHCPKPLIRLFKERSLLQETLSRCAGLPPGAGAGPPVIVCNEAHRFIVAEQAAATGEDKSLIILEPAGRNTAPALSVAALTQLRQGQDPILIMMPADHFVEDEDAFNQAMETGVALASDGFMVAFGARPAHASADYGYIRRGAELKTTGSPAAFRLAGFKEKPAAAQARECIESGDYLWNSGIFATRASAWMAALEALQPAMRQACELACRNGAEDGVFFRLEERAFMDCPSDSVDYAVMEKLGETALLQAAVVALDAGWADVGAWDQLWKLGVQDENRNVKVGDVVAEDTANSLLWSEQRLVAAVGCDNLAIIETADAVMVLNRDKSQHVKGLIAALREQDREELDRTPQVQRPWGGYEVIEARPGWQVKKLTINPGRRLSLQLHKQRSEHWVVVKGVATVTRGEEVFDLEVNESAFIPLGVKHRLENKAASPLEVIEVQIGAYLGEDDCVRFGDDFGRS